VAWYRRQREARLHGDCCGELGAAAKKVRLVGHKVFYPSNSNPLDFAVIESTVLDMCRRFTVRGVMYDPYQMAATAGRLSSFGVPMREYPQTVGNLAVVGSGLYDLIKAGGIAIYPDDEIRLAFSRAMAKETARGLQIIKTTALHKIDIVVALRWRRWLLSRLGGTSSLRATGMPCCLPTESARLHGPMTLIRSFALAIFTAAVVI
jgi:hypothetical protein